MKQTLITFAIALAFMAGLYSCAKNSHAEENPGSIILGMVLLKEPAFVEMKDVVINLRNKWKLEVDDEHVGDTSSVLVIDGYNILIGHMPIPVPAEEIKATADYNYFWENGKEEAPKHQGHIILSLTGGGKNPVKENLLYSKVVSSILNNSNALGMYMGGRSLLMKKDFYLANVEMMSEEDLPLYNWIYIGLRQENGKQSVYTFGLSDFNKKEIEILDSPHSLEELSDMIFNLAHYVIAGNVDLKDGETIGMSAEQKLKITESKGKFLEGNTLKIEY